jgi:hypothetical protein
VLFHATGFSHHPYELTFAPNHRPPDAQYVTIANLTNLSETLRRAYLRYGQTVPPGGVPLYLTEFGYQTNPPDQLGVSPGRQALYINEAEYMAWKNRAVQTLSQFLLYDDGAPVGLTFQSGLRYHNGRAKPALAAYRLPIWIPQRSASRGSGIRVWAHVRPAPDGAAVTASVQFRGRGSRRYRTIARLPTEGGRNFFYHRVPLPGTGSMRVVWNGIASRGVSVRAR